MADKRLDEIKNKINAEHKNIEVVDIHEVKKGSFELDVLVKHDKGLPTLTRDKAIKPHFFTKGQRVITRDGLKRGDLDIAKTSVLEEEASVLYERSLNYYKSKGLYGSYIDALTDFASKGFENDIDDPDIKLFFDSWAFDTDFEQIVWWVFFDFFRTGFVRTYKVLGKYEPKINPFRFPGNGDSKTATPKGDVRGSLMDVLKIKRKYETGAKKNVWSKSHLPVAYTVLNPTLIMIEGSLLFGQENVVIKSEAFNEVRKIMDKPAGEQTQSEKELIKILPNDWKKAIKERKNVPLDPVSVGSVDYRKMPYERYPLPRGTKAFESLEYKESLIQADYSTLDGISNYILKVTVGTDKHPVTKQEELNAVAELFDTPSKSFDVVWNHTLNIEKITFPEIASILGSEKYNEVNSDLDGSFGIRALIDGSTSGNAESVKLATKRLIEEVNYARDQVRRWIYKEYVAIAEAMDFERIPFVRFDDMSLRDEILMMSIVQGLIDRRIISYQTGLKKLGFDPKTILSELQEEKPLVQNGDIGIIGSPYNPKALPPVAEPILESPNLQPGDDGPGIVDTGTPQQTPKGTPSEGRPKNTGTPKKPATKPKVKKPKPKTPRQAASAEGVEALKKELKEKLLDSLGLEDLMELTKIVVEKGKE